jgi:putative hydrolase of the HAD superfamily
MVIDTILFDLDDTLIAEMEWARSGWRVVAEHLAAEVDLDPAELELMMADAFRLEPRRVFDRITLQLHLPADRVARCVELYRATPRKLTILSDAEAALSFAQTRRTGIVTDGPLASQSAKVTGAGLDSRVEVVVYTDSLGPAAGKPSTAGFREALRRLGTLAASAVYVADNPAKDFLGPHRLGMRTIRVKREAGVYLDTKSAPGGEPQATVTSLVDLEEIVGTWESRPTIEHR